MQFRLLGRNSESRVGTFIIVGMLAVVNPGYALGADDAEAAALSYCGKKPSASCKEFSFLVTCLLRNGDLRPNDYSDRRAQELKLPANGAFAKADAVPDQDN